MPGKECIMFVDEALNQWLVDGTGPHLSKTGSVTALQAFVQINFTGPSIDSEFASAPDCDAGVDGIAASKLARAPQLLVAAIVSLRALAGEPIWLARALFVQQSILEAPSAKLRDELLTLYTEKNTSAFVSEHGSSEASLSVEIAKTHLYYEQYELCEEWLEKATKQSGLTWKITGTTGKRTKFQEKDVSHLICLAASEPGHQRGLGQLNPESTKLNSELLLERLHLNPVADADIPVKLQGQNPNAPPALTADDVAILLLHAALIERKAVYVDKVATEKCTCIYARVLDSPKGSVPWSLLARALWNRSVLEATSQQTVERSASQMKSLVKDISGAGSNAADASVPCEVRLKCIYSILPLPLWKMEFMLAERYVELGFLESAIELYEKLQLWRNAALFLAFSGNEEKALSILESHLEREPTDARSWSLRGDITKNPEFWTKAWDLGKYAPAKRSLAKFYHNPPSATVTRNVDAAIDHLKESIKEDRLNFDSWFLLGCMHLEKTDYLDAASAFKQCVSLRDDDVRGWCNLGTALKALGKDSQAVYALRQALKVDQSDQHSPMIWGNLITAAADSGDLQTVNEGIDSMLSTPNGNEQRTINAPSLFLAVHTLIQHPYTGDEKQRQLCALVTVKLPAVIKDDPKVWRLVANVNSWQKKPWAALDSYEKGYQLCLNTFKLNPDEQVWQTTVRYCKQLVDAYEKLGDMEGRIEGSKVCATWKTKAQAVLKELLNIGNKWQNTSGYKELLSLKDELATISTS